MTDVHWSAPCCGVVTEWHFSAVDPDDMYLHIWRPVNPAEGTYKMIGQNTHTGNIVFFSKYP